MSTYDLAMQEKERGSNPNPSVKRKSMFTYDLKEFSNVLKDMWRQPEEVMT